ncbi:MAG: LLM class flavin-dependent oxidoreductase [Streptosporangiaceae bacterium]|nr:LLM class flavin-dependent oxidoreductase [Streptosporangiaceae bacterium]
MARAAEEAGFDSIRVGDHLLYRGTGGGRERGPLEAWTLLAALAAVTSRIRLGPLVACTAFHPPGVIAKMAATVDHISGGRFILGLGAGWNEADFTPFGLRYASSVSRFAESLEIIRRALCGERVTVSGRFWSVDGLILVPPPEHRIPLMVGGSGDRMLAIGLPYAEWWNSLFDCYDNTAEGYARLHARISRAAERAGRDPGEIARSASVRVDPGPEQQPPANGIRPQTLAGLPGHLRALAQAGADEAVIVMPSTTQQTIRAAGSALVALGEPAQNEPRKLK